MQIRFHILTIVVAVAALSCTKQSPSYRPDDFESASQAVSNMVIGWNILNALDSHGANCEKNTIEKYHGDRVAGFETGWGSARITRELIIKMKEAGFKAIRFPVTWYPHMDAAGNVDKKWMDRVEEIVQYILDADLYCILNTHHDAGSKVTRWLIADPTEYEAESVRFRHLWTQIAQRFEPYGPELIFQGYNEIIDAQCNWGKSDEASFEVANKLNQDFVDAVRQTGGNNRYRNLMVSTYGAGVTEMVCNAFKMPGDSQRNRIMVDVHSYAPYAFAMTPSNPDKSETVLSEAGAKEIEAKMNTVYTLLVQKGYPCVLGEYGSENKNNEPERAKQAALYVRTCKKYGIPTFIWYGIMDPRDRKSLKWTSEQIKSAIFNAIENE